MKLRWKVLTGLGLAIIIGGTYVYQNRVDIILKRVAKMGKPEIGTTFDIKWAQGPAAALEGERPPNIVFILADDLGINDISTFGGGLADGKVPRLILIVWPAKGPSSRKLTLEMRPARRLEPC